MTNRELLQKAMPLVSLSNEQWESVNALIKSIESKSDSGSILLESLEILTKNQSRIEITDNYREYYFDTLDKDIRDKNICIIGI